MNIPVHTEFDIYAFNNSLLLFSCQIKHSQDLRFLALFVAACLGRQKCYVFSVSELLLHHLNPPHKCHHKSSNNDGGHANNSKQLSHSFIEYVFKETHNRSLQLYIIYQARYSNDQAGTQRDFNAYMQLPEAVISQFFLAVET